MAQEQSFAESQLAVRKLGETSENFRSILAVAEQWRNLQASLTTVRNSLRSRVKGFDSDERESGGSVSATQCYRSEIDLRREFVELGGKRLNQEDELEDEKMIKKKNVIELYSDLYAALESKEKPIIEECGRLEGKEKLTNDARLALELKEQEITEKFEALERKERDICERGMVLEGKEVDMDKRCARIGVKERELELEEKQLVKRSWMLWMKEKKVVQFEKILESKEKYLLHRLESKEKVVEERCLEIQSKEKDLIVGFLSLELKGKELEERCNAIKLKEELAMSELCWAVEWKLKQTNQRFDAMEMEEKLERKSVLGENRRGGQISDANEGIRLKEKEVGECSVLMEGRLEKNEFCQNQGLDDKYENVVRRGDHSQEQMLRSSQLMDTKVNDDLEPQGLIEKQVNENSSLLQSREREVSVETLELRAEHINDFTNHQETKGNPIRGDGDVKLEIKEIGDDDEMVEEHICDVTQDLKETRVYETTISDDDVQLQTNRIDDSTEVAEDHKGDVAQEFEELKETRDKVDDYHHEHWDSKQKPLDNCDNMLVVYSDGIKRDSFSYKVNGKTLQTYLNERADKQELMEEEIKSMLWSFDNPEKLVLDAVDGFFAPHLNQDDGESELSVVRTGCLLLLEQLMNIKPLISEPLKLEAKAVAFKWLANMTVEGTSYILVLGFLLLVGVYHLTSFFRRPELERLCGMVDQHRLAPQLRQIIWLPKKHNVAWSLTEPRRETPHSDACDVVCSTVGSLTVEVCSDIHSLCKKMDARGVTSYMILCVKEHNILHDKILDALRSASDPAKLVLDVSRSFFEAELDEVDNDALKCSGIQLFEMLTKLSPSITPDVEHEARVFSAAWKERLNRPRQAPINHFGFLHFIAAFKLRKYYKVQHLLSHFKTSYFAAKSYPPEKNVDLCRALGLQNRIPALIRSLIRKQMHLEALKYISIFKMECEFPPVPLLEAYLDIVKQKVDKKLKTEIPKGKVDAATMELQHLRDALHSILNLELQSVFPTDALTSRIKQLEEEVKAKRISADSLRKRSASPISIPSEQQQKRPRIESDVASCPQFRSQFFSNGYWSMPNVRSIWVPFEPASNEPRAPTDVRGANSEAAHF